VTGTPFAIYFKFDRPTWGTRTAGDDTFNPVPSFVGKTINDVFLYRNRLGFLSDTNVCLSESGNFQNFWRRTILTTLATDPIDVSAAHPRVIKLRSAVQWNQELIIFGDLVQFVLVPRTATCCRPATVKMVAATEFDNDPDCRPVVVSNVIVLPLPQQRLQRRREYFIEPYTSRKKAAGSPNTSRSTSPATSSRSPTLRPRTCCSAVHSDRSSLYLYKWWNDTTEEPDAKFSRRGRGGTSTNPASPRKSSASSFGGRPRTSPSSVRPPDRLRLEQINVDAVQGADSHTVRRDPDNFAIHLDRLVPDMTPGRRLRRRVPTTRRPTPWTVLSPAPRR
jgi:hypothetical protein